AIRFTRLIKRKAGRPPGAKNKMALGACSPSARAAGSNSVSMDEVFVVFLGLISTATRAAAGTSSRKSPSRLAFTSAAKKLRPVALPPGCARLASSAWQPWLRLQLRPRHRDHAHLTADQIRGQFRQAIETARQPIFDCNVPALDVAAFRDTPAERIQEIPTRSRHKGAEKPDNRPLPLLRSRHERPRRRAAEQRDEIAPP